MTDYRPVIYHRTLSIECRRLRKVVEELGADVDFRDVLISSRHRRELAEISAEARLPCLVLSDGTVVDEPDEIVKYLRLRYGAE